MRYLWILLALLFAGCAVKTPNPPNIILIMADDLGWGDVSCYEGTAFQTPHIDQLAAEGLKLLDYHSNGTVCCPTRAALMTGRYQQRSGIEGVLTAVGHRNTGLAYSEYTIAELLEENGYSTAIFGKWHLGYGTDRVPVFHGFDEFVGYVSGNVDYVSHIDQAGFPDWWHNEFISMQEKGYTTHLITKHSIDFIERHQHEPFFMYVAHEAPHYPYQGPNDKADRRAGKPGAPHGSRQDQQAAYVEMMQELDNGIGQIVAKIKELGLAKNTMIFFCSDNGPTGPGESGQLRGKKGQVWEGGTRVPAIAWWPEKITASESRQTVLSMDLFPTIASIAGLSFADSLDGIDVSLHFLKNDLLAERPLFWRYKENKAVRLNQWKWVEQGAVSGLFNLDEDLSESNDISAKHPDKVAELKTLLSEWEKEMDTYTYIAK